MKNRGRPHPFYVALTAVEFAVPPVFLALTSTVRRGRQRRNSAVVPGD